MKVLQGIGASVGRGPTNGLALVAGSRQESVERLRALPDDVAIVLVLDGLPAQQVDCGILRRVAGVVMAASGLLCTALTAARELRVPVVAGLGEAIRSIADGQQVRVDGTAGTVEVLAGYPNEVVLRYQP